MKIVDEMFWKFQFQVRSPNEMTHPMHGSRLVIFKFLSGGYFASVSNFTSYCRHKAVTPILRIGFVSVRHVLRDCHKAM